MNKRTKGIEQNEENDPIYKKLKTYFEVSEEIGKSGYGKNWHFGDTDDPINAAFAQVTGLGCSVTEKDMSGVVLYVDGQQCGTALSPDVEKLTRLATPAPFGRGAETVHDETVRKALQIEGSRIALKKPNAQGRESDVSIRFDMENSLPVGTYEEASLYKLHIYPTGGHFDWHTDTQHGVAHFASGIVVLGSRFQGGDLVVKHSDQEYRISQAKQPNCCTVASWFTDCAHRVEPVTEGTRVVLQYDIKLEKQEDQGCYLDDAFCVYVSSFSEQDRREQEEADERFLKELRAKVAAFWKEGKTGFAKKKYVALALKHEYVEESLVPLHLKGVDRGIYKTFASASLVTPSSATNSSLNPLEKQPQRDEMPLFDVRLVHIVIGIFARSTQEEVVGISSLDGRFADCDVTLFFGTQPKERPTTLFHRPSIEYTGNEAQSGENKYHFAALLISPRGEYVTQTEKKDDDEEEEDD